MPRAPSEAMLLMLVDTLALLGLCLDSDHDMLDPQRMDAACSAPNLAPRARWKSISLLRLEAVLQELWPGARSTQIPFSNVLWRVVIERKRL